MGWFNYFLTSFQAIFSLPMAGLKGQSILRRCIKLVEITFCGKVSSPREKPQVVCN